MEISVESLEDQIPYYLTKTQKEGFLKALKDFKESSKKINYYINNYRDELLQGDGWTNLQIRNFANGERTSILGIILSNSCDVSADNQRDLPTNITFAPLVPLSQYTELLTRAVKDTEKVEDKINSIREQRVSSLFFLPAGGGLREDYIALLDQVHTMPSREFQAGSTNTKKVFTLSLIGFYLFLFKISFHFCRFHENVVRN